MNNDSLSSKTGYKTNGFQLVQFVLIGILFQKLSAPSWKKLKTKKKTRELTTKERTNE